MGPCELATVVPVEGHTRLVSPGQDTCDLDGGVEFFYGFVLAVDSVRESFYLVTLCRCVVCGRRPCGLGSILVGVCVMV